LVSVSHIFKKVPALLAIAVVVLKAMEEEAQHYIVPIFLWMKEQETLQLFLGFPDLECNKTPHSFHLEARVLISDCFTILRPDNITKRGGIADHLLGVRPEAACPVEYGSGTSHHEAFSHLV
jgi:hypothetical protein